MDPDLVHYFNAFEAHLMQAVGRQIEASKLESEQAMNVVNNSLEAFVAANVAPQVQILKTAVQAQLDQLVRSLENLKESQGESSGARHVTDALSRIEMAQTAGLEAADKEAARQTRDIEALRKQTQSTDEGCKKAKAEAQLARDEIRELQGNIRELVAKMEEIRAAEGDLQKKVTAAQAQVKEEQGRATEAETALRKDIAAQVQAAAEESPRRARAVEELGQQLQTTDKDREEAARQTRDIDAPRKQTQSTDEVCKKAQAEAQLAREEIRELQGNIRELVAKMEEIRAAEGDLQKKVTAAQAQVKEEQGRATEAETALRKDCCSSASGC